MKILMSNLDIYQYTSNLANAFNEQENVQLPIMVNFAIQKNLHELSSVVNIIEKVRNDLGKKYGEYDSEEGNYFIPEENREKISNELNQLMEAQQNVDIKKIKLKDLEGINLTPAQMRSLLFMIEEE